MKLREKPNWGLVLFPPLNMDRSICRMGTILGLMIEPLDSTQHYTANKIPLPSAGKFSEQRGPPKQCIIIEVIAPISAKPINLGLGVMPLMFRFHPM